jgi:GTP-binding protein HflX
VRPWQLISPELARDLCELSRELGRQLGVLLDRRGYVEWVIVGSAQRLWLPDVGRLRGGRAHFRGLRLVHTHLKDEALSRDDLADLALLRLDYVAALCAREDGLPGRVCGAHLLPGKDSPNPWRLEDFRDVQDVETDFLQMVTALEEEFSRKVSLPATEAGKARAVLVAVSPRAADGEDVLTELAELARTAGVEILGTVLQVRPKPDPRYMVGRGRLEELVVETMQKGAEMIIFGRDLNPAQARAIADTTELKVLDRTQLILDIFAQRALSRDGKLQVELAQLRYRMPRLTREDGGLSRLTGGIGGQGPGETKLEIDRRRARDRITRLEKDIEKLSRQRAVKRGRRSRNRLPVVSIVGYTNAGKSTLLNQLTHSTVFVEDKLFATLDPTSRRLRFPRDREVIVTDTVGFIRDLPDDLVAAFRATLEELTHADLLLHVVDAADPRLDDQMEAVSRILERLDLLRVPRLVLLNKCDLLQDGRGPALARRTGGILVSARDKTGFVDMLAAAEEILWREGAADKGYILDES